MFNKSLMQEFFKQFSPMDQRILLEELSPFKSEQKPPITETRVEAEMEVLVRETGGGIKVTPGL